MRLATAALTVSTRLGQLAVRDSGPVNGPGELLVLWPSILADHRIYGVPAAAWQDRHRMLMIDGPGHGDSGPSPSTFTMAQCAHAVADVLDALGIHQAVIVIGTSWGGLVAGEFALSYPNRTRGLVMMNTPVYTSPTRPHLSDQFVTWGARWIHGTSMYRQGVAKTFFLPETIRRGGPIMQAFHEHLRHVKGVGLARAVRSVLIEREPLAPRMSAIHAPTLFVAGRYDTLYPMEPMASAARTLPKGRFEALDTAHISVVDAPDEATALIDAFLRTLA